MRVIKPCYKVGDIYVSYEQAKDKKMLMDFDDLLVETYLS